MAVRATAAAATSASLGTSHVSSRPVCPGSSKTKTIPSDFPADVHHPSPIPCLRFQPQIVQYINLIRQDVIATNSSSSNSTATNSTADLANPYGQSWATSFGDQYRWISASEFAEDDPGGHGTHTAGSAAGAVVSSPPPVTGASNTTAITEVCEEGRNSSCVGGCIDLLDPYGDDLVRYLRGRGCVCDDCVRDGLRSVLRVYKTQKIVRKFRVIRY